MKSSFSRRNLLNLAGRGLTSLAMASSALGLTSCEKKVQHSQKLNGEISSNPKTSPSNTSPVVGMASLPKAKGPRVVVIGGGVAGLSVAKFLKQAYRKFDVVLVDRRNSFSAFTGSNLWCVGALSMDAMAAFSHLDAALSNDYLFFHATCTGLDRDSRHVITDEGSIAYDYVVFAPGVDYDYGKIGIHEPEAEYHLRQAYPGGFVHPMEYVSLRHKIRRFTKGVFVQTVPTGNYRCSQAPYERACLMASYFKQQGSKAKVIILDANPDVTITKDGFHAAFKELYKDYIEYVPSTSIASVNIEKKEIETEFDNYAFDDASIYPNIRGSKLLEKLGLMDDKSLQKEAKIHPSRYHLPDDKRVFVIGDSRPTPLSKSANVAYTEAKYVAKLIAGLEQGKEVSWQSPNILCYAMVSHMPLLGISLDTLYEFDENNLQYSFGRVTTNENRSAANAKKGLLWAESLFKELFG